MTRTEIRLMVLPGVLLLAACQPSAPPKSLPHSPSTPTAKLEGQPCEQRLGPIVEMLWGSPAAVTETVFGSRVHVVEQEYELAEADPPYVLGESTTRELTDAVAVSKFISELRERVGGKTESIPNARDSVNTSWSEVFRRHFPASFVAVCLFNIDVGDVEHVMVAGFDATTNRVTAVYVN